tara:strand:+ start:215283 stop:215588 length:306 start_codon:yes stop_codon:yes gene_type:complete
MKKVLATLAIAGTVLAGHSFIDMKVADAQGRYTWKHCSPNPGAVGPFYIVAPTASTAGLYCSVAYLSAQEAIGNACFRNSHGNGPWPQLSVPSYGMPQFGC